MPYFLLPFWRMFASFTCALWSAWLGNAVTWMRGIMVLRNLA